MIKFLNFNKKVFESKIKAIKMPLYKHRHFNALTLRYRKLLLIILDTKILSFKTLRNESFNIFFGKQKIFMFYREKICMYGKQRVKSKFIATSMLKVSSEFREKTTKRSREERRVFCKLCCNSETF